MPEEHFITRTDGSCAIITILLEEIKLFATMNLSGAVEDLLKKGGFRHMILNLEKVVFIDSSGVGSLVNIKKLSGRYGAELLIACNHKDLLEIINTSGIGKFFKIFSDIKDAQKYASEKV